MVTVHKPSIGLLRRGLQLGVVRVESDCLTLKISQNMESNCLPVNKLKFVSLQILYVTLYQLWYAQGYQEQASIESSVTTKVSSSDNILCVLMSSVPNESTSAFI